MKTYKSTVTTHIFGLQQRKRKRKKTREHNKDLYVVFIYLTYKLDITS